MDSYILLLCHISFIIGHPSRVRPGKHIYTCAARAFQYISFHEQSDRVSFLEGKVFQYGWIFLPFSFFTENWKVFITSILMKTAKDLEIIRGDIHIRICKHPYHTSVDVLPRLCCMRPTKSQISLGTAHSYQRLCYEYKH